MNLNSEYLVKANGSHIYVIECIQQPFYLLLAKKPFLSVF